jgi:hypothetical protein
VYVYVYIYNFSVDYKIYANESMELHMNLREIQAADDSKYKCIIFNKIPQSRMHIHV